MSSSVTTTGGRCRRSASHRTKARADAPWSPRRVRSVAVTQSSAKGERSAAFSSRRRRRMPDHAPYPVGAPGGASALRPLKLALVGLRSSMTQV